MNNNKNKSVFDTIDRICSILVLVLGFALILFVFLGPSIGIVDAESASFVILPAVPIIVTGIISVILSFNGYAKTSMIIMILLVLIVFNLWGKYMFYNPPEVPLQDKKILPLPVIPRPN